MAFARYTALVDFNQTVDSRKVDTSNGPLGPCRMVESVQPTYRKPSLFNSIELVECPSFRTETPDYSAPDHRNLAV